jgi:argininosuccinate lyase
MTRRLLAEGRSFESLQLPEWQSFSDVFEESVLTRVSGRASVTARGTPQSTQPEAVGKAIRELKTWLNASAGHAG